MLLRALTLLACAGPTQGPGRAADAVLDHSFLLRYFARQTQYSRECLVFLDLSLARQIRGAEHRLSQLQEARGRGEDVSGYIRRYESLVRDLRQMRADVRQRIGTPDPRPAPPE